MLSKGINQQNQDENSSFIMICSVVKGGQPLTFDWFKNGKLIDTSIDKRYRIDMTKLFSTLSIERVIRSDAANYSCLVKNAFGSDSHHVLMTVKGNLT